MPSGDSLLKLMEDTRASASALLGLIRKLEKDGHIRSGEYDLSVQLMPELSAYVLSAFMRAGYTAELFLPLITGIFVIQDHGVRNKLEKGICDMALAFYKDEVLLPGGYEVLNRFDGMALSYDKAFYSRMKVDDPGRLTDYYITLCDACFLVLSSALSDKESVRSAWEELKTRLWESREDVVL